MSTFSQMTDQVIMQLTGYTQFQEQATYLTSSVTSGDTTLVVADGTALSRGMVEIEDELIWVDSVSSTAATIPPYGRGFRGTTASSHASGSRVVSTPLYPRQVVKDAINQTIRSVWPQLFASASTTFQFNPAVATYALPSGAIDVLSATWQSIGPTKEWMPIRRYSVDNTANTTSWPTGSNISIYDGVVPGRTVNIVYTKQPSVMSLNADEFATVTGLPASTEDVVRLGAAYRLSMMLDFPHLTGLTAEADLASNQRQVGAGSQLNRQLYAMYQARLSEEAGRLQNLYSTRSHYTR